MSVNAFDSDDAGEYLLVQVETDKTHRIKGVVNQMKDINTGFKQLHEISTAQQIQIDELEYNYQNAESFTNKTNMEIDTASKYQQSGNKKQLTIFFIMLGIVAFLVIILLIKIL